MMSLIRSKIEIKASSETSTVLNTRQITMIRVREEQVYQAVGRVTKIMVFCGMENVQIGIGRVRNCTYESG